jgi:hypothetical protein
VTSTPPDRPARALRQPEVAGQLFKLSDELQAGRRSAKRSELAVHLSHFLSAGRCHLYYRRSRFM